MLEIWLSAAASAVCAYLCVQKDVACRRLPGTVGNWVASIVAAGFIGAIFGAQLFAAKAGTLISTAIALVAGAVAVALISRFHKTPALILYDIAVTAITLGFAADKLARLLVRGAAARGASAVIPSLSVWTFEVALIRVVAAFLIFWFLWREGRATMQWQRPNGLLTGEFLVLGGIVLLATNCLRYGPAAHRLDVLDITSVAAIALGLLFIGVTLVGYFRRTEEHRILDQVDQWGQTVQPEYTAATPECPNPQRWSMYDSMTAEVETLQFLKCLMTTMKPNLVVETGSFAGMSTVAMAEGIAQNGFGKIVTCELDERVFNKAKERIDASGLEKWVDYRNESSLEMTVDGTIDVLFSDSEQSIREQEVRRFLPQMSPNGLILIHDAASCYDYVRKAALRLEAEGLISVVLMPTARGLVIAQKRENRR